jgi:acetyl-CoA acyltransferase
MKPHRRVFVLGGAISPFIGKHSPDFIWKGHPDFGKRENPNLDQYIGKAVRDALDATGVDPSLVDKGYIGNFAGELFSSQGHLGPMVAREVPELSGKPFARLEGACASGGLAVVSAIEALQAGRDVVLALGAEVQTTVSARDGADYLARASHYATERALDDFTFPASFARRAKFYKEATGASDEDIAHVVVRAYANGNRNPNAHMRAVKMTLEQAATASDRNPIFLKNEDYREHLKISDCSQVSDGGACAVLATEEGLRKLGKSPADAVEVLSYAQANAALGRVTDYTRLDNSRAAAAEAYADAGLGPADLDVAEVHDCFAVTELLMIEALGLAEFGKAGAFVRDGATHLDGRVPFNTGGGLLAFGHPVGATGIKQVLEIYRQMTRQCGDYQVPRTLRHGITVNMGGDDRTTVSLLLRNNAA